MIINRTLTYYENWDFIFSEKAFWIYVIIFYLATIFFLAYNVPEDNGNDYIDIKSESQYDVYIFNTRR
jgi:hypothetical protein